MKLLIGFIMFDGGRVKLKTYMNESTSTKPMNVMNLLSKLSGKLALSIIITVVLVNSSCLDMLTDKIVNVVGNINCMHTGGTTVKGYTLELNKGDGFYQPIISEDVIELMGNDTVLYVKSYELQDTNFYLVKHIEGLSINRIDAISSTDFEFKKGQLFKYQFSQSH